MATVQAGFMGYAAINDTKVRCTDFNVKLTQNVSFYDHIIGLRDSIPTDILGSKGDVGNFNEQKIFWRSSTKLVEGTISFPLAENSSDAFFEEACRGDNFDVSLYYSCDTGKKFKYCKVNSYAFSATAGEGATVSVGVMGVNVEDDGGRELFDTSEKIITFDKILISGSGANSGIVSFDFTVNNNCIPIYTAGTNIGTGGVADGASQLLANAIRVGMQSVTGSITFYNDIGPADQFVEDTTPREIIVSADNFSAKLNILYQYPERTGQVSPYVRTIPFVGVGIAIQGA